MNARILWLVAVLAMAGCQDKSAETNFTKVEQEAQGTIQEAPDDTADPHDFNALLKQLDDGSVPEVQTAKPIITADGKTQIDWSQIDTVSVQKADPASFDYPFAKDSKPVINYAQNFDISAEQAQLSMMLSMASPEALGKIVDQLGDQYVAHSFRDGAEPALIIQVKPDVINEKHDYVIVDKFAEGLVLPIEIISAN